MPSKLFIPVGIPGCGKSTLAKVLVHDFLVVHETDAIRQELHPGVDFDPKLNSEVFDIFHARIHESLRYYDVFADNTSLRDFARANLRDVAEEAGAETHLLVFTNASVAVQRNLKRDRVVPAEVMVRMLEQYEKALQDIQSEHYTSVTYIEGTA